MRWRAAVAGAIGNTRHDIGTLDAGQPTHPAKLPIPTWVEIHAEDGAFYLFRLDAQGNCVADTWHPTLEEAMEQAAFEYGIGPVDWAEVE